MTTADNVAQGLEGGVIYADSRGMLQDRISSLRKANIYERQRYRHIVGLPVVLGENDGDGRRRDAVPDRAHHARRARWRSSPPAAIATRIRPDAAGALRFAERIVVCDGGRFDTLVAIPF